MATPGKLKVKRDGSTGWIVFSNVAKHNAVSYDMWRALPEAVRALDEHPDVRLIVVAGDGDKAFISGADISEFAAHRGEERARAEYNAAVDVGYRTLAATLTPTLAKIRGICFGGGIGLALSCDMRICSDDARFCLPAARLGLGYGYAGIKRIVDVVGPAYAAEILATARTFDAAEAHHMHLVNRVATAAALDALVAEYIAQIGANAPLTVRAAMKAIDEGLKPPAERDLATVQQMVDACFASNDYKEGRQAFLEKRKADFRGR
jgi:enoyl-CoA hydratase/carnithine racemase